MLAKLKPENAQDKAKIDTLVDYIGYIAGRHLRADQSQIEKNGWDPGFTTVENSALSGRFGEKGLGAIGFKAFTMDDQGRLWFFQRDDINAI